MAPANLLGGVYASPGAQLRGPDGFCGHRPRVVECRPFRPPGVHACERPRESRARWSVRRVIFL